MGDQVGEKVGGRKVGRYGGDRLHWDHAKHTRSICDGAAFAVPEHSYDIVRIRCMACISPYARLYIITVPCTYDLTYMRMSVRAHVRRHICKYLRK